MSMLPSDNKISYLSGDPELFEKNTFRPYEGLVCDFLATLSSEILRDSKARSLSDVATFAFFCRRANIGKLMNEHRERRLRLGLGTVFHIAPSNVPVNFAFSFAFGLLAGNSNIIKVPSKLFSQVDTIISAINRVLTAEKYVRLKKSSIFVRYEQDDAITAAFSALCNARVIWGGDETIRNIRSIPVPVRAVEIAFADRYSFCAMNAVAVCRANEKELRRLAKGFFNDSYLMDQNACSSPHLVIWIGADAEAKAASARFWQSLYEETVNRYTLQPVMAVDKLTALCANAIDHSLTNGLRRYENLLYVIALSELPPRLDEFRGKYGYYYEYYAPSLDVIASAVNEKYQTLTYFGIPGKTLEAFIAEHRLAGIDRFVPVGTALNISVIWDGYDIVRTLSRIIDKG